jgi:hypothetical protein
MPEKPGLRGARRWRAIIPEPARRAWARAAQDSAVDAVRSRPSRAARSPHRYWRGGGASGAAAPVSAGGVVESVDGGVVVSAGGVAVVSLGGAVCSAGGRASWVGAVLAASCFEQAATSRSAPTLRNNTLRFIGLTSLFGLRFPVSGNTTGRRVVTHVAVKRSDAAIRVGCTRRYGRNLRQAPAELSATLRAAQAWL